MLEVVEAQISCSRDGDCVGHIDCQGAPISCIDHQCGCINIGKNQEAADEAQIACSRDGDCVGHIDCQGAPISCIEHTCGCNPPVVESSYPGRWSW
ncbi:hypothetical protein ACOSQ3_018017 [Xanthoceras sorbifolium]